jgi:ferredoxin-type protein NapH
MNDLQATVQSESPKKRLIKSFFLALPMLLLTFVPMTGLKFSADPLKFIPAFVPYIFANLLFFLMVYTTKTDKYRAILFVTMAVSFPLPFILDLYEARGHFMTLTYEDMVQGYTPFCHVVIPQTLIPAIFKQEIIFPGSFSKTSHHNMAGMIVIWLGLTLVLGRAVCSWFCFWGGWEDGCARLCKKPRIKNINRKWTYLPFAVLLAVVLLSAMTLSAQYCWWLCPFKAVSEFVEVSSFKVVIQTIIFFALFAGLVIVLPILTKRRTQCSFLCPFGAMQSLTNVITPFDIRLDPEKCVNCQRCIRECPVFSLSEDSLKTGRPNMTCMRCGKCVDVCSKGAITYHIKGTPVNVRNNVARMLFLYPAFSILAIIGGGNLGGTLSRILLWLTTGSIVK